MPNQTQINEAAQFLTVRVFPLLRPRASEWDTVRLDMLRNRLYLLRHFSHRVEMPQQVIRSLDDLLTLSGELRQLLQDTAANKDSEKQYTWVRTLAAEAEGLGNVEEILSGEDTLRDIIINSIAFALNWKSNTIWIDESIKERMGIAQTGLSTLQDHIWRLLDKRSVVQQDLSIEEIGELGRSIEQLWEVMRSLEVSVQIQLLIQVYVQLIRLEARQLNELLTMQR